MKRILVLLLTLLLISGLIPLSHAENAPADRLSFLKHDATATGMMIPAAFDPYQTSYLLTVASWVSRIKLTPSCSSPSSVITIDGQRVASGEDEYSIQLNNEPTCVSITVTAYDDQKQITGQNTYTLFLQRRPSEKRTRVSAGYITDISVTDKGCMIAADLVTLNFQDHSNISTFYNDSSYLYKYRCAENCLFYFGSADQPQRATTARQFIEHYSAAENSLYFLIYMDDEIVAVIPYKAG